MNLRQLLATASTLPSPKWEQVYNLLKKQLEQDPDRFRHRLAVEITDLLDPEKILPEKYDRFMPLIRDGLICFFSLMDEERLFQVIEEQYHLSRDSSLSSRCLRIVLNFPTLHKLCQILARNRHVLPEVKLWLTQLEAGKYGLDDAETAEHVLSLLPPESSICLDRKILAEASVGVLFRYQKKKDENASIGVLKCLKPGVQTKVEEEIAILSRLAEHFDLNRDRYGLNNLQYREFFDDLKCYLLHEIDLKQEQNHLRRARDFWASVKSVHIPRCLPQCNRRLTAMDFLDGEKITELHGSCEDKKVYAEILAEALICRPLFTRDEIAVFHGDPHAGNLLALRRGRDRKVGIIDWSLTGYLSRPQRKQIIAMVLGIVTRNHRHVAHAVNKLRKEGSGADDCSLADKSENMIRKMVSRPGSTDLSILKRTFAIIEELSFTGVVFPPELVLFRKAFFTLEGVLNDLDPNLDLDRFLMRNLSLSLLAEAPARYRSLWLFMPDRPESYATPVSNAALFTTASQILCNIVTDSTRMFVTIAQSNLETGNSMFNYWVDYCRGSRVSAKD